MPLQPVAPDQPENVRFMWFYGLHANNCGTCVKKPMTQCSGEEIMREFLYYCVLEDTIGEIMPHITAIPVGMPYITSQFMPRAIKDRPLVQPQGCQNLALIGQYVELPGDVVFTVETSVRTAMMAAYGLLKLDRAVAPLYQPQYDIRIISMCLKKMLGVESVSKSDLPPVNPLKINKDIDKLLEAFNSIPEVKDDEVLY